MLYQIDTNIYKEIVYNSGRKGVILWIWEVNLFSSFKTASEQRAKIKKKKNNDSSEKSFSIKVILSTSIFSRTAHNSAGIYNIIVLENGMISTLYNAR